MENFAALIIPALLTVLFIRMLLIPMGFLFRFALHSGCGFLCLWLLNTVSGFTGISFPVNAVTVLIAGFLGLPGMGLMTLLEII